MEQVTPNGVSEYERGRRINVKIWDRNELNKFPTVEQQKTRHMVRVFSYFFLILQVLQRPSTKNIDPVNKCPNGGKFVENSDNCFTISFFLCNANEEEIASSGK